MLTLRPSRARGRARRSRCRRPSRRRPRSRRFGLHQDVGDRRAARSPAVDRRSRPPAVCAVAHPLALRRDLGLVRPRRSRAASRPARFPDRQSASSFSAASPRSAASCVDGQAHAEPNSALSSNSELFQAGPRPSALWTTASSAGCRRRSTSTRWRWRRSARSPKSWLISLRYGRLAAAGARTRELEERLEQLGSLDGVELERAHAVELGS